MWFSPLLLLFPLVANAQRFVRFISTDGKEYTGDAILPQGTTDASKSTSAHVITGDILGDFQITNQVKPIKKLLSPIDSQRVRTVRCVGFNYAAHDQEANITIPDFPILFYKPFTALNTPSDDILVTPGYQTQGNFTSTMDYETELVVVIKKKAFNISEDEALDHVLGYSVGDDVSHRGWQIDRGGEPEPQFSMGKGADTWAPWGPALVSTNIIKDPQTLNIWTKVNGVTMQNETTANMIFGVKQLVSFFSMGITLLPGDIIFTGTPAGVNLGKADPIWLVDGDIVEVGLENVGTCTNRITHTNATHSVNPP
ncbi:Fumarylacetoacetate hydrolase domain-containing protein 2 [Leucoagaricus sp. SymC.cos]|nr:Fumarylacetoacetate hydrolase domain-containing protein 2 [Leucoagaricus sp. SymC.cos]